jgi:hypothetical protein
VVSVLECSADPLPEGSHVRPPRSGGGLKQFHPSRTHLRKMMLVATDDPVFPVQ